MRYAKDTKWLPAEPFVRWVNDQLDRPNYARNGDVSPDQALAMRCRVTKRAIYRWKNSLKGSKHNGRSCEVPTDRFTRKMVEDALDRAGVFIWEVYPDIYEDVEIRDRYCRNCAEHVTTGPDHICPWCESNTREPLKAVAA